jgi:hypothetical protein|tara:strand:- start:489 stop:728 length:240 start_codon:yes stop_codon:yes gene_type:complete
MLKECFMRREPTKLFNTGGKSVKFFDYNFDILADGTIIFDEELELEDIHSQVGDLYIVMFEKGLVKLVPCDYNPAQVVE